MSTKRLKGAVGACLVALLASTAMGAGPAAAQQDQSGGYSNPGEAGGSAPPAGQYAPPPPGAEQDGGTYADQQQQADAASTRQAHEICPRGLCSPESFCKSCIPFDATAFGVAMRRWDGVAA